MNSPADIHVSLNSYLLHHNMCTPEAKGISSDRTSATVSKPSHRTTAV